MNTHILITGASRGIGAAIADALTAGGGRVVALSSADGDLSDPATPDRLWQASLERLDGRIDVLVNNAGIFEANPIESPDAEWRAGWNRTMEVNLTASAALCRRAVRVSMGTVFQVPWAQIGTCPADWPEHGSAQLHALGFKTAAMALSDRSVSIDDPALAAEPKLAIVLGTEGDGLANSTIAACDYTVKIPMSHGVDSLNVAAASAVAFWQLGRL